MPTLNIILLIISCQTKEVTYTLSTSPPKESKVSMEDTGSSDKSVLVDSGLTRDTTRENANDDYVDEEVNTGPFDVDSLSLCGTSNIGFEVGDCAQNFVLKDDTNSNIHLHDYVGKVIYLDLSSFG